MQFAERWLGIGSVVVALAGIGTLAVQLRPHHHHHHRDVRAFDFERTNCSGVPASSRQVNIVIGHADSATGSIASPALPGGAAAPNGDAESIDEMLLRGEEPDPYSGVFAKANVAKCLTTSQSVEMLIEIAADGHVANVSHRPERPTAESRCVAKVVRTLRFPASESGVTLRNVFTR